MLKYTYQKTNDLDKILNFLQYLVYFEMFNLI